MKDLVIKIGELQLMILITILILFIICFRYLEEDDFKVFVVIGSLLLTITLITALLK